MVIHKIGKKTATKYMGWGQYGKIPAPLGVGAKGLYALKTYYLHRLWSKVTCKHCLKKKEP